MSCKLSIRDFLSDLQAKLLENKEVNQKLRSLSKRRRYLKNEQTRLTEDLSRKEQELKQGNLFERLTNLNKQKQSLEATRIRLETDKKPLIVNRDNLKTQLKSLRMKRFHRERVLKERNKPTSSRQQTAKKIAKYELVEICESITALEQQIKNNEDEIRTIDAQSELEYTDRVKLLNCEIANSNRGIEKILSPIKRRMKSITKELEFISGSIAAAKSKKESFQILGELTIKIGKSPCTVSFPMPKNPESFQEMQCNEPQLISGDLLEIDNTNVKYIGRKSTSRQEALKKVQKTFDFCNFYIYRNNVYFFDDTDMHTLAERELLIKEHYFKQEKKFIKLKKEIKLFEKMETMNVENREPIPEEVRFAVWRRDGGKCAKCGSKNKLEFDHIIPVSKGGSNTERNIQLLCEKCNREKADKI